LCCFCLKAKRPVVEKIIKLLRRTHRQNLDEAPVTNKEIPINKFAVAQLSTIIGENVQQIFQKSCTTKAFPCYGREDLDPCGDNAQTLSGPEGSSNTGCL